MTRLGEEHDSTQHQVDVWVRNHRPSVPETVGLIDGGYASSG